MYQNKHIIVVGGGSIGVSFVNQLVDEAVDEGCTYLKISVIEKSGNAGGGEAYQDDASTNLLNTRADSMSAARGRPNDFLDWLRANEQDWKQDFPNVEIEKFSYLPRGLFGRYLQSVFAFAEKRARDNGIVIELIKGEVVDLIPINSGFAALLENGRRIEGDFVTLCPGNFPSNTFPHLENAPGYFNSPYPLKQIAKNIDSNSPVGIVGASLSGIDTILGLTEFGHKGKLVCVSRRGRLPSVRGQNNRRYRSEMLTAENIHAFAEAAGGSLSLEMIAQLIVNEIEQAGDHPFDLSEILNNESGAYDYLQSEIALAQGKERLWQSVIYSLNGVIDIIWHYLSDQDKKHFMSEFRSLWLSYRVSFPVQNALRLQGLMKTDRLSLLSGLISVEYNKRSSQFLMELEDPRTGLSSLIRTRYLVNATGYTNDVSDCKVPLIRNLISRDLARPSSLSGFEVDFHNGTVEGKSPEHSNRLYALGALATGAWFLTNVFEVNVRYAGRAAQRIVEQIIAEQNYNEVQLGASQLRRSMVIA